MKYLSLLIIIPFLLSSCKEPQPRKPVTVKSGSFIQESIERTKKLLEKENELIQHYIKNDTTYTYSSSEHGFWYTYIQRDTTSAATPLFGNRVTYSYAVNSLNDAPIYTAEEIGEQSYHVDQENLMDGLRKGIKLMKQGEEIKFIFPSQIAYGYKGDRRKIHANTPIICTVKLIKLQQKSKKQK